MRLFGTVLAKGTMSGPAQRTATNGIEACRVLWDAGLANPILVVTSQRQTAERVRAVKLGADDCVPEPVEIAEVVARIEALLRRRSLRTRRGGIIVTRSALTSPAGRFSEKANPSFLFVGSSNFCATSCNTQGFLRPATNCCASCGVGSRNILAHGGCARGRIAAEVGKESQTAETDPHAVPGIGYRFSG